MFLVDFNGVKVYDFHILILHFLEKTLFVGKGLYILIDLKLVVFCKELF